MGGKDSLINIYLGPPVFQALHSSLSTAVVPHHTASILSRKSTNRAVFSWWGKSSTSTGSTYDLQEAYSKHVLYLKKKILRGFKLGPKARIYKAQQLFKRHLPAASKYHGSPLPALILAAAAAMTVIILTNSNTGRLAHVRRPTNILYLSSFKHRIRLPRWLSG